MSAAGVERSNNKRSRSSRDDPLALPEKKKKVIVLPDPDAWVISDADLAKMKRDEESGPSHRFSHQFQFTNNANV